LKKKNEFLVQASGMVLRVQVGRRSVLRYLVVADPPQIVTQHQAFLLGVGVSCALGEMKRMLWVRYRPGRKSPWCLLNGKIRERRSLLSPKQACTSFRKTSPLDSDLLHAVSFDDGRESTVGMIPTSSLWSSVRLQFIRKTHHEPG
jgi:hypothetical protein